MAKRRKDQYRNPFKQTGAKPPASDSGSSNAPQESTIPAPSKPTDESGESSDEPKQTDEPLATPQDINADATLADPAATPTPEPNADNQAEDSGGDVPPAPAEPEPSTDALETPPAPDDDASDSGAELDTPSVQLESEQAQESVIPLPADTSDENLTSGQVYQIGDNQFRWDGERFQSLAEPSLDEPERPDDPEPERDDQSTPPVETEPLGPAGGLPSMFEDDRTEPGMSFDPSADDQPPESERLDDPPRPAPESDTQAERDDAPRDTEQPASEPLSEPEQPTTADDSTASLQPPEPDFEAELPGRAPEPTGQDMTQLLAAMLGELTEIRAILERQDEQTDDESETATT